MRTAIEVKCLSGLYRDGTAHSFFCPFVYFLGVLQTGGLDLGQPITPERGINKKTVIERWI